jgi:putative effector of murein hydrolase
VIAEGKSIFWAVATIGIYLGARHLHGRARAWWSSPMLLTWGLCGALILAAQASYREYLGGTQWLVTLLGPATVAFAIPVHQNRAIIRRRWRLLLAGTVVGSLLALGSTWALARLFQLPPDLSASLLPRSISTPFAISVARNLGGPPELTAAATAITGLFGAAIGEGLLLLLPLRSSFARGASLGMGAHGAGVAKARELGPEEGTVAALIMIFAGLLNVVLAALLTCFR